jgi:glucokinase
MSDYADGPRLLADIGGTNARFALETAPGRIEAVDVLACDDYASLQDAMQAYCARVPGQATPADATEIALLQRLLESYAHVSCERVLSGAGLESIYQILTGHALSAAEITAGALDGTSLKCTETVERFCAILGTVAGNVALTLCATGGVFIGGGIVPRFGDILARSSFRARFEGKGRMQAMLAAVPTYLITERYPAFAGIASMLADHLGKKN